MGIVKGNWLMPSLSGRACRHENIYTATVTNGVVGSGRVYWRLHLISQGSRPALTYVAPYRA